ncbi:ImmA/IrrE family metallo-endopeptidase [Carnobacterium maltaromaticum]|uniref:ImmA/IrrE family metallo-endopeptidase n=1 Tax=Carnobacterium maltaromaticum TaxID=2751 RepID=UPI0039B0E6FE
MDDYEDLLNEYSKEVDIVETNLFEKVGLYGVYRNGIIFLEHSLNITEKKAILIEEYNHFKKTVGIIIDESIIDNAKQENLARRLTYERLLPLESIIRCYYDGLVYYHEVAEYLNIPEELLIDAVNYYKSTRGILFQYHNYLLVFGNTIIVKNKKSP